MRPLAATGLLAVFQIAMAEAAEKASERTLRLAAGKPAPKKRKKPPNGALAERRTRRLRGCGRRSETTIGVAEGVFPSQALGAGDRGRVDQLRRLPDPARGDPAGEHRPAPRRLRLGAALQLPARHRLDGRGEDRGSRLPEDRPSRRRRARARPPLPGAADRGAGAARGRAREGQPEELDRAARRLHPRAHRPQPPLRRDPRRLPRQALPRDRPALVRDPGADRARAQPAAPRRGDARLDDDEIRAPAGRVPAALPRLPRAARVRAGARRRALPQRRPLRAERPHRRLPGEEEQPADRPLADPRLPLDRLLGPGLPGGGRPDRARARDLLPAALGRGRLHPAADRRRDDGLRPDRRRAAHPLRRLLRPRLRLRPGRRPPRQPRRARGAGARRLVHGRAPPAGLQARARADRARRPSASTAPTSAPTTRARRRC